MVLKVRIIPSVLFRNGIAVKSKKFAEYRNVGSYLNIVKVYNSRDVDELVFLDIEATNENRIIPSYVVSEIAEECQMPLTIGGGIKALNEVENLFSSSADKILLNTSIIKNPLFLQQAVEHFGSANIVASIDVKKIGENYIVFSNNGKVSSEKNVLDWAVTVEELGAGEILLNSIDNDGMMCGFDIQLIKCVVDSVNIPIIAAGGAGKPQDFVDAYFNAGPNAFSAASIFHFTQYTPKDVKLAMEKEGIPVRIE